MTTTDEVRRLLDERGVEYETADSYRCKFTLWRNNGIDAGWDDSENWDQPHLLIIGLTPEQAIEATLGRKTCHITPKFTCSECGHQYPTRNYESYETCDGRTAFAPLGYNVLNCRKPNFCPNCGRRVKEVYEC